MKKVLLIFMILVLVVMSASCSDGRSTAENSDMRPGIREYGDISLTVNIPTIHKSATQWNFELFKEKYENMEDWCDLVKNEYGLLIDVNYIAALYAFDIANSDYYIEKINSNDLSGLILVENGNFNNIPDLRDAGLILPLDEYLKDNINFNIMPEEMKNAYRLPDGQIWALPAGYNHSLYGRTYNKEWLDKLNLTVPDSLDSLYQTAKKMAYEDPNGNGISDEKGIAGKNWDGPEIFGDIFLAHDCYLSNFFQASVAFDYSTGAYEDAILKPEMKEALVYIKSLLNENIAKILHSYDFRTNGTAGSYYSMLQDIPDDSWVVSYSLIPGKEHSAMGKGPEKCLLLTSNTEDPEATINAFVNGFYSDLKGVATARYGMNETNYSIDGRNLTVNDGPHINILGDLPYIALNYVDEVQDQSGYLIGNKREYYETYSRLYNSGNLIVDTDDFLPHIDGSDARWAFGGNFTWYFMDVFEKMGTDDFISYYKGEMKKLGVQEILDKINEEAGTTSKYRYD